MVRGRSERGKTPRSREEARIRGSRCRKVNVTTGREDTKEEQECYRGLAFTVHTAPDCSNSRFDSTGGWRQDPTG